MMKKLTAWTLLAAVYLGYIAPACLVANAQVIGKAMEQKINDTPDGLKFRLSEGVEGAGQRVKQQLAATDPLNAADAAKLLKRVPEIKADADDQADFAKRAGTLPAPKTGNKIPVKFPSDEMRAAPSSGQASNTLEVVRYSPDGEVPLAPDLSVTFSQPMVAVSSQEEAAKFVPVELSPQVEGNWRWLGTKTLMFDTTKRFPMATRFTARVPAGTRSATGQTLAKDVTWSFTTPPPKVETMLPHNQIVKRDALMYISFDQGINPEAVIKTITVSGGGKHLPIRLATEAEIITDPSISYYAKQAQPGRWLAFRAVNSDGLSENALPSASTITVSVDKGTPSAEGPLTTTAAQTFGFQTYSPMAFTGGWCGNRDQKCTPFDMWYMEFNNSIDAAKFAASMVTIEPAIEGVKIYPSGNYVYIEGYKKGRTTYKVTVDGSTSDTFGQTLGKPAVATIKVGSAETNLYAQGGYMTVLDPDSKPSFSIYSTNLTNVKVRLYAVTPENWHQYQDYIRHVNYDDGKRPAMPGRLVYDEVVPVASKPDEMVETRVDIAKALDGGLGSVIVDIEPTVRRDQYDRTRVLTWLQATQIGLDAYVDNAELVGFATDLKTGKPLAGVDLTIYPNGKAVTGGKTASAEPGILEQVWNALTGWGSSQAEQIEALGSDGSAVTPESVAEAQSNRTGDNGILRLQLPDAVSDKQQNMLIARRGKDVAFLPENTDYYWQDGGNWYKKPEFDSLRWFVFDDRKMYKPKEEVAIKGYIRKITAGKFGDVEALGDAASGLNYVVKDPRDNEIAKGTANLNAFGAFDLKFKLPDNANLGYARVEFTTGSSLSGASYIHQFQIQEFRRPEFEVTTKVESTGPNMVGGNAMLSVEAKYYAGGGLANADANWTVTATPTNYTPPNRGDFTFGTWTPWWMSYDYGEFGPGRGGYGGTSRTFKGVTDASGKHMLKIDFESVKPPRPYTISASASVQDVNRQTWSSSTSLLVHPSDLYIGIRTPRTFVQKGENIEVESIVSDIDGKLVAGRDAEVKAILKDWTFEDGKWVEKTIEEQTCTVKSKSEPPASAGGESAAASKCTFVAKQGGRYTIRATVMDDKERPNESELTVWVPGGKTPPKRNVEQEQVQIIPSKKDFAPGDVAELLVISPFTPAEGVLTLRRDGLVKTERFTMKDSSITLKIPLEEKYLPNITAQVDLVGAEARTNDAGEIDTKLAKRPAFASGNINLAISTASRKLTVSAEAADKTLAPGGSTKVNVVVKDQHGEPVANSEVALVIVDESVLALSRYAIGDPGDTFYTARAGGVTDYHSRKDVLLGNPEDAKAPPPPPKPVSAGVMNESMAVGGARPIAARAAKSELKDAYKTWANNDVAYIITKEEREEFDGNINLRENFNALALFSPTVKTDSSGHAIVELKLPDNLTRYRITAVAVDTGKRFGKYESNITAKQPLMVRPSAPRFMNFGDKVDLPVVIQNQTDKDMAVDVAIRATNATLIDGDALQKPARSKGTDGDSAAPANTLADGTSAVQSGGKRVLVKANDRAEVRFPVAADKAGTARFQFVATSGSFSDAAEISLPVWTPATTEAFATYGTTDQDGAIFQPVQAPADVFPQFGGLEVTTSSTQLQELTDAYIYLANYPYECSEQIASRMISTAALRDVLTAFKSKDMPTAEQLDKRFARDLEILQSRQRDDGSFGLWKRDRERYEYPFLTVHVAHALILAKAKGYKVPDAMIAKVKPYLKDVEKHYDEWYAHSPEVRWTISAYALYVRDLMGDKDIAKTKKLLAEMTGGTTKGGNPSGSDGVLAGRSIADQSFQKAPFEALGWVLSVLANDANSTAEVQSILHFLNNRVTETAATANFVTNYGDAAWLIMYSNRRADGVLLEALIKTLGGDPSRSEGVSTSTPSGNTLPTGRVSAITGPAADLIPKLVRGLLDHRVKGAWSNTQENVFILLALDKYFNAFEKVTPDFVMRIWLGNTYAGEETFKGRSVDSQDLNVPMSYLMDQGGMSNLILDKQGAGRLYYRIGMKYAPKNLKLDSADYGFTVLRKYEAVDDPADVTHNADGTWTIKSGARVRVRLTMVAQARRYHVALVDYLPAGLEILNPELATTEAIPADAQPNTSVLEVGSRSMGYNSWWWRQNWFEHQNFRDERAEAFTSLLWEGVYNYSFVTRATTPGEFVVPPAKAEEMYHPETFGRTGTDFVKVE